MATLTVTAKGQITLKQELLRHMNVAPGQKVDVDMLPDGRLWCGPHAKRLDRGFQRIACEKRNAPVHDRTDQ